MARQAPCSQQEPDFVFVYLYQLRLVIALSRDDASHRIRSLTPHTLMAELGTEAGRVSDSDRSPSRRSSGSGRRRRSSGSSSTRRATDEVELDKPVRVGRKWQAPAHWNAAEMSFKAFFKYRAPRPVIPPLAELDRVLPLVTNVAPEVHAPPADRVVVTWVGHATVLAQLDGVNVLCDPIWSDRCSPVQWAGPKRYRPPPYPVSALPKPDVVVISHNHYDHLDVATVRELGDEPTWLVPMGVKAWFTSMGITRDVRELTWWEEATIKGVRIICTPCNHRSGRGLHDQMHTLFSSWSVVGPTKRFFFGGDTAYCSTFKQIGEQLGPFDAAAIPIGAYFPREIFHSMHVDPEHAVEIHKDIRSRWSLGIHWGTFILTQEPILEPPEVLRKAMKERDGGAEGAFVALRHGESASV